MENYLDLLIDIILENTRLSYDGKKLIIDDDNAVIQVIRILAKEKYNQRFKELKGNEDNEKRNEC